jgi:hypothetical protein
VFPENQSISHGFCVKRQCAEGSWAIVTNPWFAVKKTLSKASEKVTKASLKQHRIGFTLNNHFRITVQKDFLSPIGQTFSES